MPYGFTSDVWPGLAKLIEECGEVLEIAGKIMGCGGQLVHKWACKDCEGGGVVYPPGQSWEEECARCDGVGYLGHGDLSDAVHEELGDLLAAVAFLIRSNDELDHDRILKRGEDKMQTFIRWQEEGVF